MFITVFTTACYFFSVPIQMDPVDILPICFFNTNEGATAECETSDSCDPLATRRRNRRSLSSQRNRNGGKRGRGRGGRNIYRCHIINQYGQAVIKPMLLREL
jgi:hypothetical protein